MPQKKNSDSLELIRGKTGRVLGQVSSVLYPLMLQFKAISTPHLL